ncbi:DUF6783 domain-containing protein [Blautia marasmi]
MPKICTPTPRYIEQNSISINCDAHLAESNFQTHSGVTASLYKIRR